MAADPAMTLGASRKRKRHVADVLVVPGADDLRLTGFGAGRSRYSSSVTNERPDYPIENFASTYAKMRHPDTGLKIMDRRWRLMTYPKCFVGSEAVAWMVENLEITKEKALEIGQKLIEAGIMHHVTRSEPFADEYYFYRFQEDTDTNVLNMKRMWDSSRPARYAVEVAEELLTKLACLCEEYRNINLTTKDSQGDTAPGSIHTPTQSPNLSSFTRLSTSSQDTTVSCPDDVNYERLARSEEFREYCLASAELQRVSLLGLNHEERLTFFVNIYNTLCLHAHAAYGAPTNMWRRWVFFRMLSYRVAGIDMTLDDIEHGILRGNKRPPMLKFVQQLRPSDPRCQHVLTQRDGRIHFVISAGTKSDPPVRIMDASSCEEQLHEATEEFLDKSVKVDLSKRAVVLPRIFMWYADDFCSPEKKLLLWVSEYLQDERKTQLRALGADSAAAPSIAYENFDWGSSDAQFNAAVVRRKRRKLERQRSAGSNVTSPNISGFDGSRPLFAGSLFGLEHLGSQPATPRLNGAGLGLSTPLLFSSGVGSNAAARNGASAVGTPSLPNDLTLGLQGGIPQNVPTRGPFLGRPAERMEGVSDTSEPSPALEEGTDVAATQARSENRDGQSSNGGSVTQVASTTRTSNVHGSRRRGNLR